MRSFNNFARYKSFGGEEGRGKVLHTYNVMGIAVLSFSSMLYFSHQHAVQGGFVVLPVCIFNQLCKGVKKEYVV